MNKNKIKIVLVIVVLVALGIFVYKYEGKPAVPVVNADGTINGNYSIGSIVALDKSFNCTFLKSGGSSQISGALRTFGKQVRGDFDISQNNEGFTSHFIMTDGIAYIWTSIQPVGYKTPIASSASKNASAVEQAQIVGWDDKIDYTCTPWNADLTAFKLPTGITFLDLKN